MRMKKLLLLTTTLLLSAVAMAYDFKVDGICYSIKSDELGYTTYAEVAPESDYTDNYRDLVELSIPGEVEYNGEVYWVREIAANAFSNAQNLVTIKSLEMANRTLPKYAFANCPKLETIEDNLYSMSIENFAFAGCSKLKNVKLNDVVFIGDQAFTGTAIEEVKLRSGDLKIEGNPFLNCVNLSKITVLVSENYDSREECNAIIETKTNKLISACKNTTIPSSVTSIGAKAFYGIKDLKIQNIPTSVVYVGANAFDYTPLFPLDKQLAEGVYYIDHILYTYYFNDNETPRELVVKEGTLGIAEYACAGYKLSSLTLPSSLKAIGTSAFIDAGISELTLPASVEYIGNYAFNMNDLSTIIIPENVKYIGLDAFAGNLLTSIQWNAKDCETEMVEAYTISSSVFGGLYNLKSFTFGNNVKTIPNCLCNSLGMNVEEGIEISLPNSVEKIGHRAFEASGIKSITIPENVKSIGNNVFHFCLKLNAATWNAKSCTRIPEENEYGQTEIKAVFDVTHYLEEGATESTPLGVSSITFGNNVTNIPESFCENNDLITSVNLPSSVKSIDKYAFRDCYNLTNVTLGGNEEYIHPEAFSYTPWAENRYENAPDGPYYIGKTLVGYKGEMPENTTINVKKGTVSIAEDAFRWEPNIVEVNFPESLKEIGAGAFIGSENLKEITIPTSVTKVGDYAFDARYLEKVTWNAKNCESLLPEEDYSIHGRIFFVEEYETESSLTTFIFGDEVESIPNHLCYAMEGLESVTLPESLKRIGKCAFSNTSLKEITIPEGVEYVGGGAFSNTKLTKVNWNAISANADISTDSEGVNDGYNTYEAIIFGNEYGQSNISFIFGNKVKDIPVRLCYDLPLKYIDLPTSVETIGGEAFYNYDNTIKTITIPANVKSIGKRAFNNNYLKAYVVDANNATYTAIDGILYDKAKTKMLEVPGKLTGEITIPATVTNLSDFFGEPGIGKSEDDEEHDFRGMGISAFNIEEGNADFVSEDGVLYDKDKTILYYYPAAKEGEFFEVPSTVKTIGNFAFSANQNLKRIFMHENVEMIAIYGFMGLTSLESVVLNEGLKRMGVASFLMCENLKNVVIPSTVDTVMYGAFSECTALETVVIPASVKFLGSQSFVGCNNLRNVYCYPTTIPANVGSGEDPEEWIDTDYDDVMAIFSNFNANLHVPASALEDYKFHPLYQDFKYIIPMGEVTEPVEKVAISAGETSAVFTWPAVENVSSYTLTISQGLDVICMLDFNANGQLIGMVLNPTIRSASEVTGFQFTVTGLEGSTEYGYSIEAKDADKCVIESFEGGFATKGGVTDVEETTASKVIVSDGTISCNADFAIFNISGLDVTAQNGNLTPGVYVVTTTTETVKVLVK